MDTGNQDMSKQAERKSKPRLGRDALVAAICGLVVVLMVGASYAAVPFYNWFCRATGFNGTTQVATSAPVTGPIARKVAVRFDSNVAGGLPWKFEPEKTEIEVRIGEVTTVYYTVTNQSARTTTGQAAYNVAPLTVGASPSRPWRRARSARWRSCSMSIHRLWPITTTTR
jgi:cytochrome c oxidase assembly protein subunit 11